MEISRLPSARLLRLVNFLRTSFFEKPLFFAFFADNKCKTALRPFQIWIFLALSAAFTACEDWRSDQQDDNLFAAANAFIRFDFGNTVNGVARDSAVLKRSALDSFSIPIALSAPPQTTVVQVRVAVASLGGSMQQGTHYVLRNGNDVLPPNALLQLPPGQYARLLTFAERAQPPAGRHVIRLELRDPAPASLRLGFPGSGRGRYFDLIYTE